MGKSCLAALPLIAARNGYKGLAELMDALRKGQAIGSAETDLGPTRGFAPLRLIHSGFAKMEKRTAPFCAMANRRGERLDMKKGAGGALFVPCLDIRDCGYAAFSSGLRST